MFCHQKGDHSDEAFLEKGAELVDMVEKEANFKHIEGHNGGDIL